MLMMVHYLMEKRRYKNITHLKHYNFCCFIPSIYFLRLWKFVEMRNKHNAWSSFFILVETSSSHIFEWFTCLPSIKSLISTCCLSPKESKLKNPASFTGVHRTLNLNFCLALATSSVIIAKKVVLWGWCL